MKSERMIFLKLIEKYKIFTNRSDNKNPFEITVVQAPDCSTYKGIIYDLEKGLTLIGSHEDLPSKLLQKYKKMTTDLERAIAEDSSHSSTFSFFEFLKYGPFAEKPTYLNQTIQSNKAKLVIYKKFITDLESELE